MRVDHIRKIDVHYHYGIWASCTISRASIEAMVEDLNRFNYAYYIISASKALEGNAAEGNRELSEALKVDRRLKGLFTLTLSTRNKTLRT